MVSPAVLNTDICTPSYHSSKNSRLPQHRNQLSFLADPDDYCAHNVPISLDTLYKVLLIYRMNVHSFYVTVQEHLIFAHLSLLE